MVGGGQTRLHADRESGFEPADGSNRAPCIRAQRSGPLVGLLRGSQWARYQEIVVAEKTLIGWSELERRLRVRRVTLTQRADAFAKSARRAMERTDRYPVVTAPLLRES